MITIASITKDIIIHNSLIKEAITLGIVSHSKLAELMKPQIEKKLGKKINLHTIIMAIRRYEEGLPIDASSQNKNLYNEINVKTDISYLILINSQLSNEIINTFFSNIDAQKGDIFHIIHDQDEIGIVANNYIIKEILNKIPEDHLVKLHLNMAMITLINAEGEFSPDIIHNTSWQLSKNNIQIIKWIHKSNELLLIINEEDVAQIYNALFTFKRSIKISPAINKKSHIKVISTDDH